MEENDFVKIHLRFPLVNIQIEELRFCIILYGIELKIRKVGSTLASFSDGKCISFDDGVLDMGKLKTLFRYELHWLFFDNKKEYTLLTTLT